MVDLDTYEFETLDTGKIVPVEYFMNVYIDEVFESETFHTSTKRLHINIDDKCKKAYLNKAIKNQCQN